MINHSTNRDTKTSFCGNALVISDFRFLPPMDVIPRIVRSAANKISENDFFVLSYSTKEIKGTNLERFNATLHFFKNFFSAEKNNLEGKNIKVLNRTPFWVNFDDADTFMSCESLCLKNDYEHLNRKMTLKMLERTLKEVYKNNLLGT